MYVPEVPSSRRYWVPTSKLDISKYNNNANIHPNAKRGVYSSRKVIYVKKYRPTANDYPTHYDNLAKPVRKNDYPSNHVNVAMPVRKYYRNVVYPRAFVAESPKFTAKSRFLFQNNQEGGSVYKEQVSNQGGTFKSDVNVVQDSAGPIRSLASRVFG